MVRAIPPSGASRRRHWTRRSKRHRVQSSGAPGTSLAVVSGVTQFEHRAPEAIVRVRAVEQSRSPVSRTMPE
eukprot:15447537-Alexandrium_andersonii.AAC.1